jgi:predicted DsbA family dithiol-disulfide isomerase
MNKLSLNVFTDPTCPYAYSAEPSRWRLRWLYSDQLAWSNTMIVLSGYQDETTSFPLELIAKNFTKLREQYGMPIDDTIRPRLAKSIEACRSYVAANRHDAAKADVLLRNLRIVSMGGDLVDEQAVIDKAAADAGITADELAKWVAEPDTDKELTSDAEATRQPTAVGRGFRRKLSETSTGRLRYSAPSYQFMLDDKVLFELPGYWPQEAYEAAIGNLAPDFTRADDPKSVTDVLAWAGTPLATQEVAAICNRDVDEVRTDLKEVAQFTPLGQDGFWSQN